MRLRLLCFCFLLLLPRLAAAQAVSDGSGIDWNQGAADIVLTLGSIFGKIIGVGLLTMVLWQAPRILKRLLVNIGTR